MSLKKLSSLTIFIAILMMIYTGIILFVGPACQIANWTNWELLGLTKVQYYNVHSTFMILFIIAMAIHLYYHLDIILSYIKQKQKSFTIFTNEFIMAVLLSTAVLVGTLYEKSPFVEFLDFGNDMEAAWEKRIGHPPFTHAELSSLLVFTRKMGYDLERTREILLNNNITFREPQNLAQIAKQNDVSPRFIYELLRRNFKKEIISIVTFAHIDKKLIEDVATTLNMTSDEFLEKLEVMGLRAKAAEIFALDPLKDALTPEKIAKELGLEKEPHASL